MFSRSSSSFGWCCLAAAAFGLYSFVLSNVSFSMYGSMLCKDSECKEQLFQFLAPESVSKSANQEVDVQKGDNVTVLALGPAHFVVVKTPNSTGLVSVYNVDFAAYKNFILSAYRSNDNLFLVDMESKAGQKLPLVQCLDTSVDCQQLIYFNESIKEDLAKASTIASAAQGTAEQQQDAASSLSKEFEPSQWNGQSLRERQTIDQHQSVATEKVDIPANQERITQLNKSTVGDKQQTEPLAEHPSPGEKVDVPANHEHLNTPSVVNNQPTTTGTAESPKSASEAATLVQDNANSSRSPTNDTISDKLDVPANQEHSNHSVVTGQPKTAEEKSRQSVGDTAESSTLVPESAKTTLSAENDTTFDDVNVPANHEHLNAPSVVNQTRTTGAAESPKSASEAATLVQENANSSRSATNDAIAGKLDVPADQGQANHSVLTDQPKTVEEKSQQSAGDTPGSATLVPESAKTTPSAANDTTLDDVNIPANHEHVQHSAVTSDQQMIAKEASRNAVGKPAESATLVPDSEKATLSATNDATINNVDVPANRGSVNASPVANQQNTANVESQQSADVTADNVPANHEQPYPSVVADRQKSVEVERPKSDLPHGSETSTVAATEDKAEEVVSAGPVELVDQSLDSTSMFDVSDSVATAEPTETDSKSDDIQIAVDGEELESAYCYSQDGDCPADHGKPAGSVSWRGVFRRLTSNAWFSVYGEHMLSMLTVASLLAFLVDSLLVKSFKRLAFLRSVAAVEKQLVVSSSLCDSGLEQQLSSAKSELETKTEELHRLTVSVSKLEDQVASFKEANEFLQKDLAKMLDEKKQLDKTEERLKEAEMTAAKLEATLRSRQEDLERSVVDLTGQLNALRQELEREKECTVKSKAELERAQDEVESLRAAEANTRDANGLLERRLAELEAESRGTKEMLSKLAALRSSSSDQSAEPGDWNCDDFAVLSPSELWEQIADCAKLHATIGDFKQQVDSLETALRGERDEAVRLAKEMEAMRADRDEMRQAVRQAETQTLEAATRLKILEEFFESRQKELQKQLGMQMSATHQRAEQVESFQDQAKSLKDEKEHAEQMAAELRNEIKALEKENKRQRLSMERCQQEAWLTSKRDRREVEALRLENNSLRTKLLNLGATGIAAGNNSPLNGHGFDAPPMAPLLPLPSMPLPPLPPLPLIVSSDNGEQDGSLEGAEFDSFNPVHWNDYDDRSRSRPPSYYLPKGNYE